MTCVVLSEEQQIHEWSTERLQWHRSSVLELEKHPVEVVEIVTQAPVQSIVGLQYRQSRVDLLLVGCVQHQYQIVVPWYVAVVVSV